jgi:hypothetical protein
MAIISCLIHFTELRSNYGILVLFLRLEFISMRSENSAGKAMQRSGIACWLSNAFPNYLYGCYENCRDGNQEQNYYITEATLKFGNPER